MRAVAVKAKELRYAVDLTTAGELREENGVLLDASPEWSPEHLLLAALVRCSLKSLRYHAERTGVDVRSASGSSRTLVTKRKTDEPRQQTRARQQFTSSSCSLRLALENSTNL